MTDATAPPPPEEPISEEAAAKEPAAGEAAAEEAAAKEPAAEEPAAEEAAAEELAASEAERAALFDQLQRARADYDNLNKRKTRELMTALDRGAANLVTELLSVLDNFDYAMQAARSSDDAQLAKGVALVHEQLLGVLQRSGLEEVPGAGSLFDPAHHEAIAHEDGDGDPVVTEVARPGWRFRGQLLRPASVKVAQ